MCAGGVEVTPESRIAGCDGREGTGTRRQTQGEKQRPLLFQNTVSPKCVTRNSGLGTGEAESPHGAAARIVTIGKVRCALQSDLIVVFSDLVFINRLRDACLQYPWDIWRRMGEVCFGTGGTRGSDGGWMIVPPPPAPPPRWSLVRLAGRVSRERGDDDFDL